jgi:DNA-binding transcriptional ArsR family regulator
MLLMGDGMLTDKVELILHPVRMQIIQAVAGRQLTPAQFAEALPNVPQASLYRHIKKLADGGVLSVVGEKQIRGAVEKSYALANLAAVNLGPGDLEKATREEHFQIFTSFVISLLNEFGNYLRRDKLDLIGDGVGYRQVPLYLSDAEFMQLTMELNHAVLGYVQNQPGEGRKRRLLSTIVMPADQTNEPNSKEQENDD